MEYKLVVTLKGNAFSGNVVTNHNYRPRPISEILDIIMEWERNSAGNWDMSFSIEPYYELN